jgi:hypothetical protein
MHIKYAYRGANKQLCNTHLNLLLKKCLPGTNYPHHRLECEKKVKS